MQVVVSSGVLRKNIFNTVLADGSVPEIEYCVRDLANGRRPTKRKMCPSRVVDHDLQLSIGGSSDFSGVKFP